MNFLDLFNGVARLAKPAHLEAAFASDMSQTLDEVGIDSLDGLIMLMYLTEIYGIPEEVSKPWNPKTVQEVYDLLMAHKSKEPESVEAALESIK